MCFYKCQSVPCIKGNEFYSLKTKSSTHVFVPGLEHPLSLLGTLRGLFINFIIGVIKQIHRVRSFPIGLKKIQCQMAAQMRV